MDKRAAKRKLEAKKGLVTETPQQRYKRVTSGVNNRSATFRDKKKEEEQHPKHKGKGYDRDDF